MTANNIQNPEDHVFKVLIADISSQKKINCKQSAVPTTEGHSAVYFLTVLMH